MRKRPAPRTRKASTWLPVICWQFAGAIGPEAKALGVAAAGAATAAVSLPPGVSSPSPSSPASSSSGGVTDAGASTGALGAEVTLSEPIPLVTVTTTTTVLPTSSAVSS